MREIKFEYIFKYKYNWKLTKEIYDISLLEMLNIDIVEAEWSKEVLARRQYTWLKDKNGKEIYEWDIMQDCFWEKNKWVIHWEQWNCAFILTDLEEYKRWNIYEPPYIIDGVWIRNEIIWNIYENPELIK